VDPDDPDSEREVTGRAAHQAPETDGSVRLSGDPAALDMLRIGQVVAATVVDTEGADLVATLDAGPST
jgi:hypothetical protein